MIKLINQKNIGMRIVLLLVNSGGKIKLNSPLFSVEGISSGDYSWDGKGEIAILFNKLYGTI